MNEERFGREIKGYLNWGLDLPEGQLARLKAARAQALERQRVARFLLVPAPLVGRGLLGWGPSVGRVALPILIAAAALFGYQQWESYRQSEDLAELDAKILASDLPIDALLDSGFDQWLQQESE